MLQYFYYYYYYYYYYLITTTISTYIVNYLFYYYYLQYTGGEPYFHDEILKVSTENQKAIKVAAEAETKQVENKPEENTPYFDIQNGKMKSLFSEPEIISPETDNQKTIKGSSSQREIYIVQQGDTVVGIATKFNLSETKLRELNKLAAGEVVIPRQRIFLN